MQTQGSLLCSAVKRVDLGQLTQLFHDHGASVNSTDSSEQAPLYVACAHSLTSVARILLQHGADVNLVDGNGRTPLMAAIKSQNATLVRLLLDHGASVNAYDNISHFSCLHVAVRTLGKQQVRKLSNPPPPRPAADVDDNSGEQTSLGEREEEGKQRESKETTSRKSSVDGSIKDEVQEEIIRPRHQWDPAHERGLIIIKMLLERGADVAWRDIYGNNTQYWVDEMCLSTEEGEPMVECIPFDSVNQPMCATLEERVAFMFKYRKERGYPAPGPLRPGLIGGGNNKKGKGKGKKKKKK